MDVIPGPEPVNAEHALTAPYQLPPGAADAFREGGFVRLSGVLSPDVLAAYGEEVTREVLAARPNPAPLEERSTYDRAFLQVTNLWRRNQMVREFVLSPRLGRIAAELMGVRGVRLYHDQALYKEPSGGHTPWHADQFYWPLASDRTCTAWIPLQDTPLEMGPLAFARGSHRTDIGRDLPIGDESEQMMQEALEAGGFPTDQTPFAAGDVSVHGGWTFHRAGPNTTDRPRRVMTVIYMDIDMRLAESQHENHELDREAFCPGIAVGALIDSPLNPIIYESAPTRADLAG